MTTDCRKERLLSDISTRCSFIYQLKSLGITYSMFDVSKSATQAKSDVIAAGAFHLEAFLDAETYIFQISGIFMFLTLFQLECFI